MQIPDLQANGPVRVFSSGVLSVDMSLVHDYYLTVLGPVGPEPLVSLCHPYQIKDTNTLWKTFRILTIIIKVLLLHSRASHFN